MTEPSDPDKNETTIKIVTIITLGVIVTVSIIGLTVVAIFTDRDSLRSELLTFFMVAMLATLGGMSWVNFHRKKKHWHVSVDRDEDE